ncbi:hypothetical protein CA267_009275 [Alteromonas pelagimontana]|uniref:Uncharacterized protein n=1 Tax=Alteromonas pelagimontana TaxID=1858656 RepID=A0A6M4MEE7_9ALTE|nr:hypothetical protein [Alteromonas pelagimontana]QJR80955.1 hypothetical protein CA267_009275 [Alteromonas pelagimontana]
MKNSINYPSSPSSPLWLYPAGYIALSLCLSYFTGLLNLSGVDEPGAQRDFNAAVGMPLLTGYFWWAIRLLHQKVASTLMSYLLDQNALSHFSYHRLKLAKRWRNQKIAAFTIAVFLTAIYLLTEDLLAVTFSSEILVLNILAVPFWFFFWLFLFQITSSTQYVIKYCIHIETDSVSSLKALKRVSDLGVENIFYATVALAIIPVFWLNKDVPAIDVIILVIFTFSLVLYLFFPAFRVYQLIATNKSHIINSLDSEVATIYKTEVKEETQANLYIENLRRLQNKKEEVETLSKWPLNVQQCFRVALVIILVPSSWVTLSLLEHLIG